MTTTVSVPGPEQLDDVLATLRRWQHHDGPFHLHPGDLGWHLLRGAATTAQHLRLWHRDGRPLGIGLLDGVDLLRTAVAPSRTRDAELGRAMAETIDEPEHGVLPAGQVFVEAHSALSLRQALADRGWSEGEPWIPLRRDLTRAVEAPGLHVEQVGPATLPEATAVHRSAFDSEGVTDERFRTMTTASASHDAVTLLGRDRDGAAVAMTTVWSAGVGRPGLIEPLGVHADHRGRGHGRAICRAAAAQLRRMGATAALVCTPCSRPAAVRTYLAAGFSAGPEVPDLQRLAG